MCVCIFSATIDVCPGEDSDGEDDIGLREDAMGPLPKVRESSFFSSTCNQHCTVDSGLATVFYRR